MILDAFRTNKIMRIMSSYVHSERAKTLMISGGMPNISNTACMGTILGWTYWDILG